MSALTQIDGDLLKLAREGKFDAVVQGCNCYCTFGSGLALQVKQQYPQAYEIDRRTKVGDRSKLGSYTSVDVPDGFTIYNAYTQYQYGGGVDHFEYAAFEHFLDQMILMPHKSWGFPEIGCGLAGGNRERIYKILEDFASRLEDGRTATVVVYKP
jgi:O-acetyl-ADP-ribose deacetylase (regulator of RNase III)